MFKNFFKKKKEKEINNKNTSIIALLVHAAKIDENYTEAEKEIIKKVIVQLNSVELNESEKLLKIAEKVEENSNQIVEFTKEIKKYSMESRLKIIEIIWKIVYSDGTSDIYETNLIRRLTGLLYLDNKLVGDIKEKIKNKK